MLTLILNHFCDINIIFQNVIDKYPAPTPTTTPAGTPGPLTPHRKPPSMRPLTAAYQASSLSHDVRI